MHSRLRDPESPIQAGALPAEIIETDIPPRLDRLPWGRFHALMIVALGVT